MRSGVAGGRRAAGVVAVVAAVVVGSWALRFAGQGTHTPLDTMLYFLPTYEASYARLAQGIVPLWNPYQLAGIPWIATLQGGFFYPFHVLYVVLPLHVAFMASNVLHLLLVAIATALFVRRLGLGDAAAVLAAVVLTLRGSVPVLQFSPNFLEAYAWLPVGAIACLDLVERPGRRAIALLAGSTGMSLLAGYPQPTVYVVYTWAALTLALAIGARLDVRRLAGVALGFAAGVGLGAMLGAVQMLPAAELARLGVRPTEGLAERAMFPMGAELTPGLMRLRFGAIAGKPSAFGVAVLALAPMALLAGRRRAVAWCAVALAVVTILFELGELTPAFSAYRMLPALAWFRDPSRIHAITEFAVAIAAAFGFHALVGSGSGARTRVASALGAIAAGAVVWLASGGGWVPDGAWPGVAARAAVTVAVLAIAAIGSAAALRIAAAGMLCAVLVETNLTPATDLRLPYAAADVERFRAFDAPIRAIAAAAGHDRIWRYGDVFKLQPENGPKLPTLYRFRSIDDYEPLTLARQSDYFTYLTEGSTVRARPPWLFGGGLSAIGSPPDVPPAARRRRLIDLLATRFLVIPPGLRISDAALLDFMTEGGWVLTTDGEELKVFENPRVLPRAFVTYRTRRAPPRPDDLLRVISRPDFDPLAESWVEGAPLPAAPDAPRGHPVAFVRDGESEVELEATLDRPGLVVLADTFYPGWRATVDGRPAPILATNHLFRGVAADAGTHRIRFVYAPASVRLGAACTLAGVIVLLWLGWGRRRARP